MKPIPLAKSVPLAPLPSFISNITTHLTFRQSLINDYLLCPQMSLYRWLLQTSTAPTFFSAILGTAGHAVISEIHATNNFGLSTDTLSKLFRDKAKSELCRLQQLPQISVRFQTHEEQIHRLAPEYVQLLWEYCQDKRNQSFHPTINETSFVLELPGNSEFIANAECDNVVENILEPPFLFTGTIDQAGFYDSGDFAIRDIKFRESAFKPDGFKLNFNKQLTLYTAGLRFGVPSCEVCRPATTVDVDSYLLDDFAFDSGDLEGAAKNPSRTSPNNTSPTEIVYHGPCATCAAKIGTNFWPQLLPARSELIWMRDYKTYERDQYKKYMKHPTQKTINPKTARVVRADIVNPKYLEGYKKGSHRGPAILTTTRSLDSLAAFMAEMQVICRSLRLGLFYRREGDHCTSWCRFRDACLNRVELQMGPSLTQLNESQSEDQFTQDFFS